MGMYEVSARYKEQMNKGVRNRGHIRVTVGIINNDAQKNIYLVNDSDYPIAYYSYPSAYKAFKGNQNAVLYASDEQNFTKVDGSMRFLPSEDSGAEYYYNGVVADKIVTMPKNGVLFQFGRTWDIKGLTINFGDAYPTRFMVRYYHNYQYDYDQVIYDNDSPIFITEDLFENVCRFVITPITMVGGEQRLRIITFNCGVVDTFSEEKVMDSNVTNFSSPISESIPSRDMTIKLDNIGQRYSPDNPDSLMNYMERGQKISVSFGYDLDEEGTEVEWLDEIGAYLTDWSADNTSASLTAKDTCDNLTNTQYTRGGSEGAMVLSLYWHAETVLADAGVTDYELDESLKDIYLYNPIPVVSHAEALQLIANMGMCSFTIGRSGDVQIKAVHKIPDFTASSNNETPYSDVSNILDDSEKDAYANDALNFTLADGNMFFATADQNGGYYSKSVAVNTESGQSITYGWSDGVPIVTLTPEESISIYGMTIWFREIYPTKITVRTYDDNNTLIDTFVYENDSLVFVETDTYTEFAKMEIEFTEAPSGTRVVIDYVEFEYAAYYIGKSKTNKVPIATRSTRIKAVEVVGTYYNDPDSDDHFSNSIYTGKVYIETHELVEQRVTINFSDPMVVLGADITSVNAGGLDLEVLDTGRWFVTVGITPNSDYEYGHEQTLTLYGIKQIITTKVLARVDLLPAYQKGTVVTWTNPLISEQDVAEDVALWLADYYKATIDYNVSWRGDPCLEVNDLIDLESTIDEKVLARLYQNTLQYNGAWSGSFQARKVDRNVMDNSEN